MKQKGYSLVELVIVLVISVILFVATVNVIGDQIESNKIRSTRLKIETLTQALENYRIKHNALPCPALFTASEGSVQYGVATTGCATSCSSGMTCSTDFVIGAVPTFDLELGSNIELDDWENKIAYAVDSRFTQEGICQVEGTLTVNNIEAGVTNTVTDTAAYVLVSFGKDGVGAYSANGTLLSLCPSGALETENCNNDSIFLTADINKQPGSAIYFDDIVGWNSNSQILRCPAGIEGCSLWLDAADICSVSYNVATNTVPNWIDKSINNYNAVASGVLEPTFNPSALFNNNPYINFSGSNLMNISSSTVLPNTNFTEIMVFRTNNNANAVITAASDSALYTSNANRQFGLQNSGNVAFSISSGQTIETSSQCGTASPYCADNNPHIAVIVVDSINGQTLYVDGVVNGTSAISSTTLSGQSNMLIGGHNSWGYYTGNVMEILVYNRVLTLNEIKAIDLYLASKWNVSTYNP